MQLVMKRKMPAPSWVLVLELTPATLRRQVTHPLKKFSEQKHFFKVID